MDSNNRPYSASDGVDGGITPRVYLGVRPVPKSASLGASKEPRCRVVAQNISRCES